MGLILCQWAKTIGAKIVDTVGTEEKAEAVRAEGCDDPADRPKEESVAKVREVTDGAGAAVDYEGTGRDTLQRSLDFLRLVDAYGHFTKCRRLRSGP